MTQTATIYLRVSTAGQAEDGVSLDAQKAKAEGWALANGYTVEGVYTDAGDRRGAVTKKGKAWSWQTARLAGAK